MLRKQKKGKKKRERKKNNHFFCYFIVLSQNTTLFTVIAFRGKIFLKKASFSPTVLHLFSSKNYY